MINIDLNNTAKAERHGDVSAPFRLCGSNIIQPKEEELDIYDPLFAFEKNYPKSSSRLSKK